MDSIVASYRHPPRCATIPDILFARQQLGMCSFKNKSVTTTRLASKIAWNPTRMQNMILSVGPGTPATVFMARESSSYCSSSSSAAGDDEEGSDRDHDQHLEDREQDEMDDDADNDGNHADEIDEGENDNIDVDSHSVDESRQRMLEEEEATALEDRPREFAQRLVGWMDSDGEQSEDEEPDYGPARIDRFVPSLRHGGCINTASWLTSPWRLSLCDQSGDNASPVFSDECPTQLITSGDDRLVKFWDVRHAMGTSSPLPGGKDTICPFSSEIQKESPADMWKEFHAKSTAPISGSVIHLATLQTRHFGNVFHVTPLDHEPGKVVTCGADGYLRCSDLVSGSSTIIVSPEYADNSQIDYSYRMQRMCFSHHFVDTHSGLLCSDRGLLRFDIRVNPREQQMRSMLSNSRKTCKTCAIWSKDSDISAYVFAGGASANVALYDLRMTSDGGPLNKVVQLYRPRGLSADAQVSVSGIDLSKNKKELLVSYENDQIYTFPICPSAACASGPSVDEMLELAKETKERGTCQPELCAYGGHLNRYTFLKNAKYAGPSDEYICTGSDSGHGWIFEKSSGSVVSFLCADSTTCNGVIPHPSLPLFVTYGIDSTAKLWRATIPVDRDLDDSPLGRSTFYHHTKRYNRSPLVSRWEYCGENLLRLTTGDDEEDVSVMPDQIPPSSEIYDRGMFGGNQILFLRQHGVIGTRGEYIGNDLQSLPEVLRRNLYSCILARQGDEDDPVKSNFDDLKRRISLICLQHQAHERGLVSNPDVPWQLEARPHCMALAKRDALQGEHADYAHPADLIPMSPSDWLPYDPEMTNNPQSCSLNLNIEDYGEFYRRNYVLPEDASPVDTLTKMVNVDPECAPPNKRKLDRVDVDEVSIPRILLNGDSGLSMPDSIQIVTPDKSEVNSVQSRSSFASSEVGEAPVDKTERAFKVLQDTVTTLKDSGNTALQAGLLNLAARRYDQAIRYCAVVYMKFPCDNLDLLVTGWDRDPRLEWTPMLKLLVSTRLNLSMVLLKLPEPEPRVAISMAETALHELRPFTTERGKVFTVASSASDIGREEPESTFVAAAELEAKGYFRLGSAQSAVRQFSEAVKSFEACIASTMAAGGRPEAIVVRRLEEAKLAAKLKSKKLRKKMRSAFGGDADD